VGYSCAIVICLEIGLGFGEKGIWDANFPNHRFELLRTRKVQVYSCDTEPASRCFDWLMERM